jgi:ribonuclease-3
VSRTQRLRAWLLEVLGFSPLDLRLFETALTHRSASGSNNERLEFLGDAVLSVLVAEHLFEHYVDADEGALSRMRSRVVSGESLARRAAELGIGELLHLGPGELKSGGYRRESILADALEGLIGALYLEGGLDTARAGMLRLLQSQLAAAGALEELEELKDPKTRLQELLQARGLPLPRYSVQSIEGELHARNFRVSCEVEAIAARAEGAGSSRRRAEQAAAADVLAQIQAPHE